MALSDYRSALVTGASSGIGEAAVRRLRGHGLEVHAVARRAEKLEKLAIDTGCIPHVLDLTDTEALYGALSELPVDVLVNNAGLGRGFGPLHQAAPADIDITFETNVVAFAHVLRAVLPGMVERRNGHVFNIGSVAGLYAINSPVYGGSKGAVHLMSINLRVDLVGTGIRVTEICPGRVDTPFFQVALEDAEARQRFMDTGTEHMIPDDVVDAVLYALDAPWRVNVGRIEITPTEQVLGGASLTPVQRD